MTTTQNQIPCAGICWNDTPARLNEWGFTWEWAEDEREDEQRQRALAYYGAAHDSRKAALYVTDITDACNTGIYADPDHDNEPVCTDCLGAASISPEEEGWAALPEDQQKPCWSCYEGIMTGFEDNLDIEEREAL